MAPRVGIGIITYNRRELVAETIACVREYTRHSPVEFVVADDGSTDGTAEMCRESNICCVTGSNRGVAWNKNRALYMLSEVLGCELTILLEDDTQPTEFGWEAEWIAAAARWGHVNFAAPWIGGTFLEGSGTASDPIVATAATAQCAAFSCEALISAGYFDSRFKGYGDEHIEHTQRLIRHGFGGAISIVNGSQRDVFYLLRGGLTVRGSASYFNDDQVRRNRALAGELSSDLGRRDPWCDAAECSLLNEEIRAALSRTPNNRVTIL